MKFLPFAATQMDFEGLMLREVVRPKKKDKYCMTSLICGI